MDRSGRVGAEGTNLVRIRSRGASSSAVNAEAATAMPRDASGCVESAISATPGSGSESTADKKELVHASTVDDRTE
jgi:hypothetical protein